MVINTTFLSGATFEDTEFGVTTLNASGGLNLVAKMKKDSSRKATSHMAVMSMFVLLRGILALGIVIFLNNDQIFFYYRNKTQKFPFSTQVLHSLTIPSPSFHSIY